MNTPSEPETSLPDPESQERLPAEVSGLQKAAGSKYR